MEGIGLHLIFDLDGTLVDSRPGILKSLNVAIRQIRPDLDPDRLNFVIGKPIREMIRKQIKDLKESELDSLEGAFRNAYDGGAWKLCQIYPGVRETLQYLVEKGFTCYLVTNKPEKATQKILKHLGLGSFFKEIVCPDSHHRENSGKKEMINFLVHNYALSRTRVFYIGDTADDYQAALANKIEFIGVTYGYGNISKVLRDRNSIDDVSNLLPALGMERNSLMIKRDIFEDLFVLELANNHWSDVNRGLRIIKEFGTVVRFNNVYAAIKLQFRDVDNFIHKDFRDRQDIRYIKKTIDTHITREDLATLVEAIRRANCVRMATPFDEKSVDLCVELGIDIIKVGSSDITDWPLLEKIAKTQKPVIVSTGGSSLKDIDDMVVFFEHRGIPLAINHCVSLYPSEDSELQLNQIDFLKRRYPGHVIGFSTHEYHDWQSSIMIAYAKGARTFERHIDIKTDDKPFSAYCSTPEQIAEWFHALKKAQEMCGAPGSEKVASSQKEIDYLNTLVRGVYAKRDLSAGNVLTPDDYYLAIPLQKGQLSCRELLNDQELAQDVKQDAPLMVDSVASLYSKDKELRKQLHARGL